jgi:hypothetical protein
MAKFNSRTACDLWHRAKGTLDEYGTLTKKGNGGKKPKRYSIECGEDVHCISILPDGAIHLHNHPDSNEMHTAITHDQLAFSEPQRSKLPPCLRLIRFLRDKVKFGSTYMIEQEWGLERHLADLVTKVDGMRVYRQQFNVMVNPDTPSNFREAFFTKLQDTLSKQWTDEAVLDGYRTPEGNSKTNQVRIEFTNSFTGFPSAEGRQIINKSRYDRCNYAALNFVLTQKWYVNCYMKGRFIVEGLLVMDIIKAFPNGTFLCTVAKPGHGYKVSLKQAVVDFTRQRISWVNDENKVSALMEGDITPRKRRTKAEMQASKTSGETKEV